MQRIKSVLNPGYKKDEEVMYGTGQRNRRGSTGQAESRKESNNAEGDMQPLNPDGEKHTELQHSVSGAQANKMSTPPESDSLPDNFRQQPGTDTGRKGHSMLRQILKPGGHKADSTAYGNTASVESTTRTPVAKKTEGLPDIPTTEGRFMESPNRNTSVEPGQSELGLQNQSATAAFSNNQNTHSRDGAIAGARGATTRDLCELDKSKNTTQPASPASDSAKAAASAADPKSSNAQPQTQDRITGDAIMADGSGVAVAGGDAVRKHREETNPEYTFDDPSPYSLRALDPRVDAIARKIPGAWPRGDSYSSENKQPSEDLNAAPEEQKHHLGRTTAVVGGVGAASLGASEVERHDEGQDVSGIPETATSSTSQHEDTREPYGNDTAVAGELGATGVEAHDFEKNQEPEDFGTAAPATTAADPAVPDQTVKEGHHYGRDAALIGGAGVAAGAALETDKHGQDSFEKLQPATTTEAVANTAPVQVADSTKPDHGYGQDVAPAGTEGIAGLAVDKVDKRHDATEEPPPTHGTASEPETALNGSWTERDSVPSVDQEYDYGGDATLTGEAGAAAFIGADEIAKKRTQRHRGFTDPVTSIVSQQAQRELLSGYDDQRVVLGHRASVASTGVSAGADAVVHGSPPDWVKDHHLGREGAMAGGAIGLLDAGALYEGEKQHDATAAIQQPENDPEYEYVKTYRSHEREHEREHTLEYPNWTPERSHTRKESKEHKHGGLLGKILRPKSKAELQVESAVADDETSSPISPNRGSTTARGPEDTIVGVEAGVAGADEPKRHSSERKKHSPKLSGEFAHLRRNKLHKEPPPKYFQQHHAAGSSGSDSPPALSSAVSPSQHIGAYEMMGDSYADSGLASHHVSGFGEEDEFGGDAPEPHAGFPMEVGNHATGVGGMNMSTTTEGYGPR